MKQNETFKTVPGYEDYQVSDLGRVITNKHGLSKFLKPQQDALGYLHVRLYSKDNVSRYKNGNLIPTLMKVHRLVLDTFSPSGDTTLQCNHKDGDKTNNQLSNLEWVTAAENIQHSWDLGLRDNSAGKAAAKRWKACKLVKPDGTEEYYQSRKHFALAHDIRLNRVPTMMANKRPFLRGKFKGCMVKHVEQLPPGETFKKILGLEEKLLEYKKQLEYQREATRKYYRTRKNKEKSC